MDPQSGVKGYRLPPQDMVAIAEAPPVPRISIDPTGSTMAVLEQQAMPSITQFAQPELRLAGIRFSPRTNGPSRARYYTGVRLRPIEGGAEVEITDLPSSALIGSMQWSPNGKYLAFTITSDDGIALWVAETDTGQARQLSDIKLNEVFASSCTWYPDSQGLLCRILPPTRSDPPAEPKAPTGPSVQEAFGATAPGRTYQDLLKNAFDEELFSYYAASQVAQVAIDGEVKLLGPEGLHIRTQTSPNGQYVLVETLQRPFSYLVTYRRFPRKVVVWDGNGQSVFQGADLPLAEDVPISRDAVAKGRRQFGWRSDADATLYWIEAKDEGDPQVEAAVRDQVFMLSAPFKGEPTILASLGMRYSHLLWGSGELALVYERWWKNRRMRTWRVAPDAPDGGAELLFDRSTEDAYTDPGHPLLRPTERGRRVLVTDAEKTHLFLAGRGSSPEGDRPFVDRFDLVRKESERIWRSQPPYYESPALMLDAEKLLLVTSRESVQEPANFYIRNLHTGELKALTDFPHPYPAMRGVTKEIIQYQRADGITLTARLYLPAGYEPGDGPLPMLMWAYPREFKSAAAASQLTDSPYRFVRISPLSPLSLLTQGYAILDGPTMPIIGEGDNEPNDSYVAQLRASAKAAVEEVVRRGVADPKRIAVGGHSYGAFMTANLLAHTDLFCAGIARSGAYNRTLTPFGFQAEERTLWEAVEVYLAMSPFINLRSIEAPLLLIHGEADNNSGTHPLQSERFYAALKGHGKRARLTMLPYESHGYSARESVLHVLWEMHHWLDEHCKG